MFQDTGSDVGGRYPYRSSGMRLITQRSQVQILSPLPTLVQVRGPFALRSGRAFGVGVNEMSTAAASGRGRMLVGTGGYRAEVGEPDGVPLTVASVTLSASERCCSRSWRPQASMAIPTARVCRGTGPLPERRPHWVRLVLTPCAIS